MGCKRKISCLLIVFLVGVFWWMPGNRPAMGNEPSQSEPEQDDISHWIAELESRLPDSGNNTEPDETEDFAAPRISETYGNNSKTKLVSDAATDKISVDLFKVDLHNVFRLLGQVSGKNIVVDESVKGTITLALENVPWTFVLDVMKNLKGLDSIERHNTIMIYPADQSLEWGGDTESTGTLDVQVGPLLIEKDGIPGKESNKAAFRLSALWTFKLLLKKLPRRMTLLIKLLSLKNRGRLTRH